MGWISPGGEPIGLASFNLQAEKDKLAKKRKLAALLGFDGSNQLPSGIMTPGGPGNVGIYKAPSSGAMLASLLQKGLGIYNEAQLSKSEDALGKLSQDAFASQLNHLNDRVRNPDQDKIEAAAELTREGRRVLSDGTDVSSLADAANVDSTGEPYGPQAVADRSKMLEVTPLTPLGQAEPVKSISTAKPAGKAQQDDVKAKLAAALTAQESDLNNPLGASSMLGRNAAIARKLSGEMTHSGPTEERTPARRVIPQAAPQQSPQAAPQTAPQLPTTAMPLGAQQQPPMPPGTQPVPEQPYAPVGNPDPYSRAPTTQEMMVRLNSLAQTGPMGAQIASAQLQQMFGDKNGEYKVDMSRDPQTGELAVVRYSTKTGKVDVIPMAGGNGKPKVIGQADTPNGLYNRMADGSMAPAQDGNGNVVMGAEGNKRNEQVRTQTQTISNAIGSIDAALAKGASLMANADAGTGFWNNWKSAAGDMARVPNAASAFHQDEASFKANLALQALSSLKAVGNGSSGMGGISDKEGGMLMADIGALSSQSMNAETYKAHLNDILVRLKALRDLQLQFMPQGAQGAARQPGTAPQQLSLADF